ncbi:MAG: hypothetical protein QOF20_795 [Acidimicrobiaceae bacterium]|nr:hypothetical protein [Acidimicrobiaceae bacterium]
MVRVSHPFHPWFGREFLFVRVTQTWGEDRVFFVDQDDELLSLPLGWTDAAPVDVFVEVAAGPVPFPCHGPDGAGPADGRPRGRRPRV